MNPSLNTVEFSGVQTFFDAYALVTSATDNIIHVSYFDEVTGSEGFAQTYSIPAKLGIQVGLRTTQMIMTEPGDIPQFKSCHITADHPVNIQYFSVGGCSGGGYLALATPSLGKKYVVASYNDNPGEGASSRLKPEFAAGEFMIIAAFDNTNVKIIPSASSKGGHPGARTGKGSTGSEGPYSVGLRRGQCYLVKSTGEDNSFDMSGSIVEADRPIIVLGGHENANLGSVGSYDLDARDYMVEQMIPVEAWDTTGYVSVPLKDPLPFDPTADGAGENYRVFTYDSAGAQVVLSQSSISGGVDMFVGRLTSPARERFNVSDPVEFNSRNGKKFSAMMYDLSNHGTLAPFPAPSMMTIIPISRWSKTFMWYVPSNTVEILQLYYVNVLSRTDTVSGNNVIMVSFNNSLPKPIKSVLTADGQFKNIPNHPEITATRYKLQPGSYVASSEKPFMVYNFGYRSFDVDGNLGDFDNDDYLFEYANPVGATLSSGDPAKFKVTIDSQCTKWNICITDQRKFDPGIRSVSLLKDADGIVCQPGRLSLNCRLDAFFDPKNVGEIELDGRSPQVCFSVLIENQSNPAIVGVLITDNAGNKQVLDLQFAPPSFAITPSNSPIEFGSSLIPTDSCVTILFKNTSNIPHLITGVSLRGKAGHFNIQSVSDPLPKQLDPSRSISMNVCFSSFDTLASHDTIAVGIDCLTGFIPLMGSGSTPLISASDVIFEAIDSGKSACQKMRVSNIGKESFTLSKQWKLSGSSAFQFSDTVLLPDLIAPGSVREFQVCYAPQKVGRDTAFLEWNTDIAAPYNKSIKSFSKLTGQALAVSKTSVAQTSEEHRISIRPNPASGKSIFIVIDGTKIESGDLTIHDVLGREVYKRKIIQNSLSSGILEIPLTRLKNGTYYVRIEQSGTIYIERFELLR